MPPAPPTLLNPQLSLTTEKPNHNWQRPNSTPSVMSGNHRDLKRKDTEIKRRNYIHFNVVYGLINRSDRSCQMMAIYFAKRRKWVQMNSTSSTAFLSGIWYTHRIYWLMPTWHQWRHCWQCWHIIRAYAKWQKLHKLQVCYNPINDFIIKKK